MRVKKISDEFLIKNLNKKAQEKKETEMPTPVILSRDDIIKELKKAQDSFQDKQPWHGYYIIVTLKDLLLLEKNHFEKIKIINNKIMEKKQQQTTTNNKGE